MTKDLDSLATGFDAENSGGLLTGFLAEEDPFDRRSLWRLGSWGVASVACVVVAILANQSSISFKRDELASIDLAKQSQQIQSFAKASQSETRRLASAVDTLNGDRDRLYSRLTVIEQGLDSVTGAISRQPTPAIQPPSATPEPASPAPVVAPVATTTTPISGEKSSPAAPMADPAAMSAASAPVATAMTDPAAGKPGEAAAQANSANAAAAPATVASTVLNEEAGSDAASPPKAVVQRTEFGADVGGANSVDGLRALWRSLLKSNKGLSALRPIIVVREGTGGAGMQLRLVVGPVSDAATAARICAVLIENRRACDTTVFDGQRLVLKPDDSASALKPLPRKRAPAKRASVEYPAPKQEAASLPPAPAERQN